MPFLTAINTRVREIKRCPQPISIEIDKLKEKIRYETENNARAERAVQGLPSA